MTLINMWKWKVRPNKINNLKNIIMRLSNMGSDGRMPRGCLTSFLGHVTGNRMIRDWAIVRTHVEYHPVTFQKGRPSNNGGDRCYHIRTHGWMDGLTENYPFYKIISAKYLKKNETTYIIMLSQKGNIIINTTTTCDFFRIDDFLIFVSYFENTTARDVNTWPTNNAYESDQGSEVNRIYSSCTEDAHR